ncbi:SDR family NAD(P)-dependent oxidoreductase [Tsukamurella tyrosinosolvens]|uniref:SDR family NAD(P)-dependent oxidoreductase n=1 Tax=Tsukamurella tyrosinosolvens TaxID=57704 RepID=UPI000C7F5960|nr:SDR family NAD(P)-dependent oxidoreductase [Tsukamurella tyrosinosolvens]AUN40797.1 short-chain dehydrogenase [Tsukamurella tyrosinosolvens]
MTSIAVVTGAGRGIGLRFAHRLADQGHRVILTDVDGEAARAAAAEVGRDAVGIAQDVRDLASHRDVAERARDLGRLAVWVNNAGILIAGDCWDHEDDQMTSILDVNLRGPIGGSAAAVNAMGARGGAILNVASISALTPVPGLALYAATKAAVLSFTTSLQGDLEHAGLPIRARALCPDVVSTAMVTDRSKDPGAALLFSGPKPLDADRVAAAGLDLLDSRQVFRVVPRWRGALVRSVDLAPSVGLKTLGAMRRIGDFRQRGA